MGGFSNHAVRVAAWRRWAVRAAFVLLPLASFALLSGCNPAALAMMLMPFIDDTEPPKCKVSSRDKERTVALVTTFANPDLQLYPELRPFDHELSDRLVIALADRYQKSKENVKIVPNSQVRPYLSKVMSATLSPVDLGKKLKADYVIALDINRLALHEKGAYQLLCHGNTEIAVKVYDVNKEGDEKVVFDDFFSLTFPKDNPIEATGSIDQFRAAFVIRVARELSRWFARCPTEDRMYKMTSD
jgi:hypothetical protein